MIPDYPYYRLFLNGELILEHGSLNSDGKILAKRSFEIVNLGSAKRVDLAFEVIFDGSSWMKMSSLVVANPKLLTSNFHRMLIIHNLTIGILLVTIIYQLSLFFLVPDRMAPLYCSLFLFSIMLRSATTGPAQPLAILLPEFDWEWNWKLGFIGYYMAIPFMMNFLKSLFPGTISKNLLILIWSAAILFSSLVLFNKVSFYGNINWIYQIITLFTLVVGLRSFVLAFRKKMVGSRIMLLAIGTLTFTTIHDIFLILGFFTSVPLLDFGLVVFVVSQTIIISVKFSHAFGKISHMNQELRKIVYDHVIDRIIQGDPIESTMPRGHSPATVICFDIVKSSDVNHPGFPAAVDRVMARCSICLNRHYDPKLLSANGYRIKEMGDGLIASIGFPFTTPQGQNSCDLALTIAEEFCAIFRQEMQQLGYSKSLYCSIGLAYGMIEGFYPQEGIRQYDVRGRTLMLATRYESMRNIVFEKLGHQGSVIFIQEQVYKQLEEDKQSDFLLWDCQMPQSRIRDDQQANQAWVKFVAEAAASKPLGKTFPTKASA